MKHKNSFKGAKKGYLLVKDEYESVKPGSEWWEWLQIGADGFAFRGVRHTVLAGDVGHHPVKVLSVVLLKVTVEVAHHQGPKGPILPVFTRAEHKNEINLSGQLLFFLTCNLGFIFECFFRGFQATIVLVVLTMSQTIPDIHGHLQIFRVAETMSFFFTVFFSKKKPVDFLKG